MTTETVYSRFKETAERRQGGCFLHVLEETAAVYGIDPGDISYADMLDRVQEWRDKFLAADYGHGHRIGLLLQNRPVFIEIWLALNSLGASVVPINPDLRVAELEYIAEHSEMVLAIVNPERLDEMQLAVNNAGLSTRTIVTTDAIPHSVTKSELAAGSGSSAECALLYTSGTTGQPKGCILSNEYYLNSGDWYAQTGGLISLRKDCERMITPLPVFHMNAMAVSVMGMITVGGCLTVLDRFHPSSWWDSVRKSKATCIHYLGVMPSMLMGAEPSELDKSHNVRFGFGAGIDKKLHEIFETRYGFPLIEAWAMTETGSGGVISAHEEPRKIGTSCFGHPTSDIEIRIVDDAENQILDDTPGELLVRRAGNNPSYGFFSGYLKNEPETNLVWKNGWFHTGDIVTRDEDGDLHFVDRKKNVIRRSGENIAAVEVETILNRHPDISQSAVAAIPDEVRGDEVAVFLVMDGGQSNEEGAKQIVKWALDQMAYYKAPGWICFVGHLPLTATQKLLRGEVKKLVTQTAEQGGFYDMRVLKKRKV